MSAPETESPIQVVVRVRAHDGVKCLSVRPEANTVALHGTSEKVCTFDRCFDESTTQQGIFDTVGRPLCDHFLAGYNTTLLAYGQTGAGKSYTMHGPDADSEQRGVVPRALEHIFKLMAREERTSGTQHHCVASYLEIYNENVIDLLDTAPKVAPLRVREDVRRGTIFVENATEEVLLSCDDAMRTLAAGTASRAVGATAMNRESSRSHSVFTLHVRAERRGDDGLKRVVASSFHLVDLAGSERQTDTGSTGARLKEACNINRSLSTLGNCITALVSSSSQRTLLVPYRESKLTLLLRDSLGGNARTTIVANVSPLDSSFAETLSTLNFAQRAKLIKNRAVVNDSIHGSAAAMQAEIHRLRAQLATTHGAGAGAGAGAGTAAVPRVMPGASGDADDADDGEAPTGAAGGDGTDGAAAAAAANQRCADLEVLLRSTLSQQTQLAAERDDAIARYEGFKDVMEAKAEQTRSLKLQLRLRQDHVARLTRQIKGEAGNEEEEGDEEKEEEEEGGRVAWAGNDEWRTPTELCAKQLQLEHVKRHNEMLRAQLDAALGGDGGGEAVEATHGAQRQAEALAAELVRCKRQLSEMAAEKERAEAATEAAKHDAEVEVARVRQEALAKLQAQEKSAAERRERTQQQVAMLIEEYEKTIKELAHAAETATAELASRDSSKAEGAAASTDGADGEVDGGEEAAAPPPTVSRMPSRQAIAEATIALQREEEQQQATAAALEESRRVAVSPTLSETPSAASTQVGEEEAAAAQQQQQAQRQAQRQAQQQAQEELLALEEKYKQATLNIEQLQFQVSMLEADNDDLLEAAEMQRAKLQRADELLEKQPSPQQPPAQPQEQPPMPQPPMPQPQPQPPTEDHPEEQAPAAAASDKELEAARAAAAAAEARATEAEEVARAAAAEVGWLAEESDALRAQLATAVDERKAAEQLGTALRAAAAARAASAESEVARLQTQHKGLEAARDAALAEAKATRGRAEAEAARHVEAGDHRGREVCAAAQRGADEASAKLAATENELATLKQQVGGGGEGDKENSLRVEA